MNMSVDSEERILIGARIPTELQIFLNDYCKSRGITKSFFVTQAVKEKLHAALEDEEDRKAVEERLADPDFFSAREMKAHLGKRGVKL